ncbi:D-lactate ferricytochrome c oxidoreductase, partial [Coemansia sp. S17]
MFASIRGRYVPAKQLVSTVRAAVPRGRTMLPTAGLISRVNYHKPARNEAFKRLTKDDLGFFRTIVPSETILATAQVGGTADLIELEGFNADWLNKYRGNSQLVLRPKTTEQVSQILQYCNTHNIAVVPQGGNTGLVGGSVPVHDEIVLSL